MVVQIRITAAPPSNVAPDEVREAWVGVEMNAMPDAEGASDEWVGEDNIGGYLVKGAAAMHALDEAGKDEALAFWKSFPYSLNELRFGADCCEVVPIDAEEVRAAVERLSEYGLHSQLWQVDGDEAHRILPLIWPVIKELLLVSDACEAGMVEVRSHSRLIGEKGSPYLTVGRLFYLVPLSPVDTRKTHIVEPKYLYLYSP